MLELNQTKQGTLLTVKVSPNAPRDAVLGCQAGALRLAVAATPEKGRANRRLTKFLARLLEISPSRVEVVRGQTARDKSVLISGLTRQRIGEVLAVHLGD